MSATEDFLGEVHKATAEYLLARLRSGEATSADISNAIKFLKDNGIEAAKEQGAPITELLDSVDTAEIIDIEARIGSR